MQSLYVFSDIIQQLNLVAFFMPFLHAVLFLKVSEAGVHRPHVGGIHGRSNDGSYSLVLAGGFEDEVVSDFSQRVF